MRLEARDVSMGFNGDPVLDTVSVAVESGDVFTVVGPSGTGKTTLLRLLATFRRPESGTILADGTDLWDLSESDRVAVRRRTATVFQEPSLFNAPVCRNVTYGTRIRRSWRDRLQAGLVDLVGEQSLPGSARNALEAVGLADEVDRNALSLSGGEAQRVAFARALAVEPEILLLDEPTSNLDPRNTAVLEGAIRRASDRGVGVVVATHDMHQAERLSDRVGFLFDGELVEVGPPDQLFEDPRDPRTKRFIDGELLYDRGDETPGQHTGEVPADE